MNTAKKIGSHETAIGWKAQNVSNIRSVFYGDQASDLPVSLFTILYSHQFHSNSCPPWLSDLDENITS